MAIDHHTCTRVAIIEDEPLLGDLLGSWVTHQPDLELVGVYGSRRDAQNAISTRVVDVMVVDLNLPDGDGVDLASDATDGRLGGSRPRGIVILSGEARPELVAQLPTRFDVAWAYLLKSSNTTTRLRQAIDAVMSDLVMIDPELRRGRTGTDAHLAALTVSERQVLELVATGRSNRAIADELHLSVKTVERMLTTIYTKLGIDGRDDGVNPRVKAALRFVNVDHRSA